MTEPEAKAPEQALPEPRRMRVQGFVSKFKQLHKTMQDRPFLFVLGAGASVTSGIPPAAALVDQWLHDLYDQDPDQDGCTYHQWLAGNRAGISDFDPRDPAAAYSAVYEQRFGRHPEEGDAFLEHLMHGKRPSYGYTVLARILAETNHRIVITVNFDNLVADALAMCSDVFPLVCGHESLIRFAKAHPRRPVVLKVHNDLLLGAKSRPSDIQTISEAYRELIGRLLAAYTPVVIGYGGNDGSLMATLAALEQRISGGVYWCFRLGDTGPSERVRAFVAKQNGYLVGIPDFDSVMVMLGEALGLGPADQLIRERANKYADRMGEDFRQLRKRLADEGRGPELVWAAGARGAPPVALERTAAAQAAVQAMDATTREPEGTRRWWQWIGLVEIETDPDRKDAVYRQALAALPDDPRLLNSYAVFLENVRKDHDAAEAVYRRAIEADPKSASALSNYAFFLTSVRKDTATAEALYRRAIAADPKYTKALSNYATFLTDVRKDHDAAEALFQRAVEADPQSANALSNYAVFLKNVRKGYDAAEALYKRAIEADPDNANTLNNYAVLLTHVREDRDAAEALYRRAIAIERNNAVILANYAQLVFADGRTESGQYLVDRAMELRTGCEPDTTDVELLFYSYAHGSAEKRPECLRRLRALLSAGIRSPGWDLSRNVERAIKDGHPEAAWLPKLAAVVADEAPINLLDAWPAWRAAGEGA